MPLKVKYQKILAEMIKKYGKKKGTQVFHAWTNKQNVDPEQKAYFFTTVQFKAIDDDTVEGHFAVGLPDKYNDILTENCLDDMEIQIKSMQFTMDDDHESFKNLEEGQRMKTINPIAKIESTKRDGIYLNVKAVLNKVHRRYVEIKGSIKHKFLHSFSFAFFPLEYSFKSIDGVRHRVLEKVRLLNGCFTGVPVNEFSQFTSVALKSLSDSEYDESEIKSLIGGIFMAEENEGKDNQGEKPEGQEKPEGGAPSENNEGGKDNGGNGENGGNKEATEANVAQVKALTEQIASLGKGMAELKGLLTTGEENKDIAKKMVEMKAQMDEFDKVLSSPQFKGMVERKSAAQALNEQGESKAIGPIDFIQ